MLAALYVKGAGNHTRQTTHTNTSEATSWLPARCAEDAPFDSLLSPSLALADVEEADEEGIGQKTLVRSLGMNAARYRKHTNHEQASHGQCRQAVRQINRA
jgi:hypothetical protein